LNTRSYIIFHYLSIIDYTIVYYI